MTDGCETTKLERARTARPSRQKKETKKEDAKKGRNGGTPARREGGCVLCPPGPWQRHQPASLSLQYTSQKNTLFLDIFSCDLVQIVYAMKDEALIHYPQVVLRNKNENCERTCSHPSKAIRVRSPAGSLRIFASGNRAGRCRWSAGFLGDVPSPPSPPPFHSGAAPILTSTILIGSQDHDAKKDTNDTNSINSARRDKSNTERMTQLPQFIPELYEEEVDNSTQWWNADVAIASSPPATSLCFSRLLYPKILAGHERKYCGILHCTVLPTAYAALSPMLCDGATLTNPAGWQTWCGKENLESRAYPNPTKYGRAIIPIALRLAVMWRRVNDTAVSWSCASKVKKRGEAIRATLTRTPSVSSLLRAMRAAFPSLPTNRTAGSPHSLHAVRCENTACHSRALRLEAMAHLMRVATSPLSLPRFSASNPFDERRASSGTSYPSRPGAVFAEHDGGLVGRIYNNQSRASVRPSSVRPRDCFSRPPGILEDLQDVISRSPTCYAPALPGNSAAMAAALEAANASGLRGHANHR
ncbi:hypothetical protein PR048_029371 [Dryococelus australis]|uniref:Uncharacterized protein n=1 Tax=Dryococelus australis TaxID=614101 RepID=A0ABQ9GD71_9NEOP|nr:hypothetical protein PR048_029371 [Dryococelus australis]